MKPDRKQLLLNLSAASRWQQAAYDEAVACGEAEVAGHIRAAQMSLNAALGALAKTRSVAS